MRFVLALLSRTSTDTCSRSDGEVVRCDCSCSGNSDSSGGGAEPNTNGSVPSVGIEESRRSAHASSPCHPCGGVGCDSSMLEEAMWARQGYKALIGDHKGHAALLLVAYLLCCLIVCALPSPVVLADAISVKYGGSVYHGVATAMAQDSRATLTIQVSVPAFPASQEELATLMTEVLATNVRLIDHTGALANTSKVLAAEGSPAASMGSTTEDVEVAWRESLSLLMNESVLESRDDGRLLYLRFANCSSWRVDPDWLVMVVPCLPLSLFKEATLAEEFNAPNDCLAGDPFLIHGKHLVTLDTTRWAAAPTQLVTGSPIEVPLISESESTLSRDGFEERLRVMEGTKCLNARGANVRGSLWDGRKKVYRFTPQRGGIQTLCYIPYPVSIPQLRIKVMDSYEVAGPEGMSTEPLQIRSGVEFTGMIYGTNLTESDTAVITEQLCAEFVSQNVFFVDLSLSSRSRATFFGTFHERGIYHVCYCHGASQGYVRVSTLVVERDMEVIIDNANPNVLVDQNVKLVESTSVTKLKVQSKGSLDLRGRTLNVSSFLWSGGVITGKGTISCTGFSKITTSGYETRKLQVPLYNYGEMTIEVQRLTIDRDGVIHNYGNLTLLVSSMGEDGISSVQSLGRSNMIQNHADACMRIIAVDQRSYSLLTGRFIISEGTIVISGRVNVTDTTSGSGTRMVLRRGTMLTAYNTRISGNLELEEGAAICMVDGSVFISTVVNGTGSVHVKGGNVLLDSLTVAGNIDVMVGENNPNDVIVSVYGTTSFNANSRVFVQNANFVTSTGLAKLLFSGVLVADAKNVQFIGSMVIQVSGTAVFILGKHDVIVSPGETQHSTVTTFFAPPNSTVFFVDSSDVASVGSTLDPGLIRKASGNGLLCGATAHAVSQFMILGGQLIVRGCYTVPNGATITGSIKALVSQAEWDHLHSVVCTEHRPEGIRLCGFPMLPPPQRNGISFSQEVHARNAQVHDLDEFALISATMRVESRLVLEAKVTVIDENSWLSMEDEGDIAAEHVQVDGEVKVAKPLEVLVVGNVTVGEIGHVALTGNATPCRGILRVHGLVSLPRADSVTCLGTKEQRSMDADEYEKRLRVMQALPIDIPCPPSILADMDERRTLLFRYWIKQPYNPPPGVPSTRDMLLSTIFFLTIALTVFRMLLYLWGSTWSQWYRDLIIPPPLRLTLTWYQFSYSTLNYIAFGTMGLMNMQSTMSNFHPGLPASMPLAWVLCMRSINLLMPHHNFTARQIKGFSAFVATWCGTALLLERRWNRMDSEKLSRQDHGAVFTFVFLVLRKLDVSAAIIFSMFQTPVASMLYDGIACPTLLRDLPSCAALRSTPVSSFTISFCALVLCSVYVPWRFSRYQNRASSLDLRVKVAAFFLTHTTALVEVGLWKVCYSSPILQVCISFVFHMVGVLANGKVYFTPYHNVNRFLVYVGTPPLLVHVYIFLHVLTVRMGWVRSCTDGEAGLKLVLTLCVMVFLIGFWRHILYVREQPTDLAGDANVDAIRRTILVIRTRINDLKAEAFTTKDPADGENILNAIARLRIEFLEKHERYRYETRILLRRFHLGEDFEIKEMLFQTPHHSLYRRTLPNDNLVRDVSDLHYSTSSVQSAGLLTIEEMESFSCGPALGKGSYGTVHQGILSSGKLVAVKYVNVACGNKDALGSVMAEVNMLRELSHPNIIHYYGAHTIHDTMLVFMEFAVGGSLTSILRKFTELAEPVLQLYACQFLRGLQYLHGKGVVHRDIKGENILIDGAGVAKLADFGCSKSLANIATASQVGCGTLVGSPFWMAPEVIRSEAYGTKADIWSVGCTVVEMLNGGQPPWREEFDNVYSAMFYVGSTTDIPQIPEDTSDTCRDFLYRCFERDVAKRATADELLQHPWLAAAQARMDEMSLDALTDMYSMSHSNISHPLFSIDALPHSPRSSSTSQYPLNGSTTADQSVAHNSSTTAQSASPSTPLPPSLRHVRQSRRAGEDSFNSSDEAESISSDCESLNDSEDQPPPSSQSTPPPDRSLENAMES